MLKKAALDHFGTQQAIADALDISVAAVSQWKDLVPPLRAAELQEITHGKLTFDPSAYRDRYRPSRRAV